MFIFTAWYDSTFLKIFRIIMQLLACKKCCEKKDLEMSELKEKLEYSDTKCKVFQLKNVMRNTKVLNIIHYNTHKLSIISHPSVGNLEGR